ncbi:CAP domain-containing protein [Georgenia satyanarayanai]|uniref:CAP domain-containing protein n=1 Tax=Georgenia satyanarayanai TaxID=860221 RepID=UPI00203CE647|nr:CAP domain-containing protein [Georgenia satyanarayanai]MCM3661332.1 CAP domain-containing protein [Georgenia satyanarayanai]
MLHGSDRYVVTAILVLALLLASCSPSRDVANQGASVRWTSSDPAAFAEQVTRLTNEVRSSEELHELEGSDCARDLSLKRAAALVGAEELKHAPLAPVILECSPWTVAAENLVRSTASPEEVVGAWLNSPGHRANIVDPELTEIGVGCVPDGEKMLCSQLFLGP